MILEVEAIFAEPTVTLSSATQAFSLEIQSK
jgi:hypothetical protein